MKDSYAPDGVISHGERIVRKNGLVYFGGYIAQDEKLLEWVGKAVLVTVDDYFFQTVSISDARDYCKTIVRQIEIRKR